MSDPTSSAAPTQPSSGAQLATLFLVALALRLAHLFAVHDSPLFTLLWIDPKMYDEWGWRISGGNWIGDAPFFLDPLYPYFVGAIYAVCGRSQLAVAIVQAVIGAAVAPLIASAARPWFSPPVPLLAGLFAALYRPSIFWSVVLMKPGLALGLSALALWLASRALQRGGSATALATGVAFAAVALLRGPLLLVVAPIGLYIAWASARGARVRQLAAFFSGVGLILAATMSHNLLAAGEPILTTSNWGPIFFIGNNPDNRTGRFEELPWVRSDPTHEQIDFKREAERRVGHGLTHRESSSFWFSEGLGFVRASPTAAARLLWNKLRIYWGIYETPASLDYYLWRRESILLRLPLPGFGLVGALGLAGLAFAWPGGRWPRLLILYVVGACLATISFFVLTRFRMVVLPALFVLAAQAAVESVRLLRAGRLRAAFTAALLLVAGTFVALPVRSVADTWSFKLASRLGLPRQLEKTANAQFNLGVTWARLAKDAQDPDAMLASAERSLRGAIAEERQAKFLIELGKVLARRGHDREAIESYREAETLTPRDWQIPHALGLLGRRAGDPIAAEAAFRRALAVDPRRVASVVQLGELLRTDGRVAEAEAMFRHALVLDPNDTGARRGLTAIESR